MSELQEDGQLSRREGRISRSWRLTRTAWQVVRADRSLLALAIIAAVTGAAGMVLILVLSDAFGNGGFSEGRLVLVALVFAYPLTFVSVFFNTAIAAAAGAALEGRHLSLSEALAVPMRRLGQVALWALIAAAVGFVIEQLASRLPLGGSIVARLVGLAWSLASLFAIPVLALEGCSAPECLRRSAHVIKERWGEGIGGSVIITAWMALVILPVGVALAAVIVAAGDQPAVRDFAIALAILAIVAIVALQNVVRQTFAVALYRFATTNAPQGPFADGDLRSPFGRRRVH